MGLHQFRRCCRHPGIQGKIDEAVTLERLEESKIGRAGILEIVAHRHRDVTNVAGLQIKCARLPLAGVAPFLAVPVILWLLTGLTRREWIGFGACVAAASAVYLVARRWR